MRHKKSHSACDTGTHFFSSFQDLVNISHKNAFWGVNRAVEDINVSAEREISEKTQRSEIRLTGQEIRSETGIVI